MSSTSRTYLKLSKNYCSLKLTEIRESDSFDPRSCIPSLNSNDFYSSTYTRNTEIILIRLKNRLITIPSQSMYQYSSLSKEFRCMYGILRHSVQVTFFDDVNGKLFDRFTMPFIAELRQENPETVVLDLGDNVTPVNKINVYAERLGSFFETM